MSDIEKNTLACIYTDGLTIDDPSMLSTLSLFYDEIYLPHPYDLDPEAEPLMSWPFKYLDKLEWEQKKYISWVDSVKELFDAEILKVLPAPIPAKNLPNDFNEEFVKMTNFHSNYYSSSMVFEGYLALTVHSLFSNSQIPEWALNNKKSELSVSRDHILNKWFNYRVPRYRELHPQQILELRVKVSPYKEGTRAYINSKLLKLYEILKNTDFERDRAIELLVRSDIETELYDLERKKFIEKIEYGAGIIKRAADFTGEVIKTIALPWNWANICSLVEKFGGGVEYIAGHYKNVTSKENRALQLIGTLESV